MLRDRLFKQHGMEMVPQDLTAPESIPKPRSPGLAGDESCWRGRSSSPELCLSCRFPSLPRLKAHQ